jgi:catabolite regulation protein CreA
MYASALNQQSVIVVATLTASARTCEVKGAQVCVFAGTISYCEDASLTCAQTGNTLFDFSHVQYHSKGERQFMYTGVGNSARSQRVRTVYYRQT